MIRDSVIITVLLTRTTTFSEFSLGWFFLYRGGPIFDPVPNFGRGSHVTHMHAVSLLIQLNFSWENNHVTSKCSKNHFWSTFKFKAGSKVFRTLNDHVNSIYSKNTFDTVRKQRWKEVIFRLKSHDHYFEEKFNWIKSETACIWVTWPIF